MTSNRYKQNDRKIKNLKFKKVLLKICRIRQS